MEIRNRRTLEQIVPLVKEIERENAMASITEEQSVMLFFSYDVVNSTRYKANNKGKWSPAIGEIMRYIVSNFANSPQGGYRFWKTLGDEIIFMKEIYRVSDIFSSIEEIYERLNILNSEIDAGMICEKDAGQILGIKGTAWLAEITANNPEIDDIFIEYQVNDNRKQTEYLGPNIDIGFRLADNSMHNRLVISFNIAHILLEYRDKYSAGRSGVVYITSKELKGVWNGVPHPIFMYEGENREHFQESIPKYQKSGMKNLTAYLEDAEARAWQPTEEYELYEEKVVAETCRIMNLEPELNRLIGVLEDRITNPYHKVREFTRVHYTALCYRKTADKLQFMLVKDPSSGLWGFGGACMYHNFQYIWTIKKYYKKNYGTAIVLANDDRYQSPTPFILTTYDYMETDETLKKGTVFLGEILQIEREEEMRSLSQTSTVRLIDSEELEHFTEPRIENFDQIIKQATEYLIGK